MRHKQGESRQQTSLLPDSLDDFVPEDHPVRVIDAYIDSLDMAELGFTLAVTKETGRKPYHPADMLKLYVYGYINQVRSSRRLEKECQRNLELLWLMTRLSPDHKTISNFRKQNGKAIKQACRTFIGFCREAHLLSGALIAIDGSKFKAAGSKDNVQTKSRLREQRKRVDRLIENYLEQLSEADKQESLVTLDREQVSEALKRLQTQKQALTQESEAMDASGKTQHCTTEPDARLMRSGRDGMVLGYNVQNAVDTETGLIVHHDVTNATGDNSQLLPMAIATRDVLEKETLEVVADGGYSNAEQLAACDEQGIVAIVPVNRGMNNQGKYFQKSDFKYDSEKDNYHCPAGEVLEFKTVNTKDKLRLYARTGCDDCALQPQCTRSNKRWVSRHMYEKAFEQAEARLAQRQDSMRVRMMVERPFAILKQIMGLRSFCCWGQAGAESEMAIAVFGYNLNNVINRVGTKTLLSMI